MKTLRVGAVPYLNIEPFLHALEDRWPCEVIRRPPSALPQLWQAAELDLCLLSTVDLLSLGLEPLEGASISCEGAVESVLLVAGRPPRLWSRVALDRASSTSNRLARLVIEDGYCRRPVYRLEEDPAAALGQGGCDAALLIGDRALQQAPAPVMLDLGMAWRSLTGLPFVFAAWTLGRGSSLSRAQLEDLLAGAVRASRRFVEASARDHARRSGLSPERLERYLQERISYRFGPREREGMDVFRSLLAVGADAPEPGRPSAQEVLDRGRR